MPGEDAEMFNNLTDSYPGVTPCTSFEHLIHFLVQPNIWNACQPASRW